MIKNEELTMKEIFKNYEAFYNMVLSTTIMSNTSTPELDNDARRIIEFIGKAYKFEDKFIEKCTSIILDELSSFALTIDQDAVYTSRELGDKFSDKDVLFDIKGDVLNKLNGIFESRDEKIIGINRNWFDYTHYKTYEAHVRFSKINIASASGSLICTKQAGILKILGIGCEENLEEGIYRLMQCAIWGDIPSMYLLAYAYKLAGNEEKSKLFYEISEISKKYLNVGYTELSKEVRKQYSEEAYIYFVYIATIKQDIINACHMKTIDFSFIEAITSDKLDYYKRMYYINNYERKEWKEVTNSSREPSKVIGFK